VKHQDMRRLIAHAAARMIAEDGSLDYGTASGRRLGSEAKKLRAAGTEVALIQPTLGDLAVMGRNLMATKRRHEVIETARRTVAEQIRELGLPALPPGEPHKLARPEGHPSTWPEIAGARAA